MRPWSRLMIVKVAATTLVCLLLAAALCAQGPALEPKHPEHPSVPTVTFVFDWPSVQPDHYSIAVDSSGRAAYQSHIADGGAATVNGDPEIEKFTASDPTRTRIFQLAGQAGYFHGNFNFTRHKVAFSGNKTLIYADPDKYFQTTYNWSANSAIQELTSLFEAISNTIEAGKRLEQLLRFDKLGLEQELKYMEDLERSQRLLELQTIQPVLQQIASDPSVMNVARERAQRLLKLVPAQAPQPH